MGSVGQIVGPAIAGEVLNDANPIPGIRVLFLMLAGVCLLTGMTMLVMSRWLKYRKRRTNANWMLLADRPNSAPNTTP